MLDYVKKSLLTGGGMALRSRSEIRELAKKFARSKLDKRLETTVEKILKKLDMPTRSYIQALNNRIDDLIKKIEDKS